MRSFESYKIFLRKLFQWIKNLNLFKRIDKCTENDLKEQRIITDVYLISLIITIFILVLFNSLNTEIISINVSNPSLNTYNNLESFYPYTLKCPCSRILIPYKKFVSFSPRFHQICSSDYIGDRWLLLLKKSFTPFTDDDWRNRGYYQFNLLSKFCQLSNETVENAIKEFLFESFILSNLLSKIEFNIQIEKILIQFFQSTIIYFENLIDAVDIHIQVDQPYMIKFVEIGSKIDLFSIENQTDIEQLVEVFSNEYILNLKYLFI